MATVRLALKQIHGLSLTPQPTGHFSKLLASLTETSEGGKGDVSLGDLMETLGHRSAGSLMFLLSLPMVLPIPAPGIATVFGVPLALISAQLMFGQTLWLPKWLASRCIARAKLQGFVKKALPTVCKIEKLVKPRLEIFTRGWALRLVGAICAVMAIIMALPIPMGNVVPGVAIALMALGMIERDGALILAGFVVALLAVVLIWLGGVAVAALGKTLMGLV